MSMSQEALFDLPGYLLTNRNEGKVNVRWFFLRDDKILHCRAFDLLHAHPRRIARNEKKILLWSWDASPNIPCQGIQGIALPRQEWSNLIVFNQQKHMLGQSPHCSMYYPCTKMEKKRRRFGGMRWGYLYFLASREGDSSFGVIEFLQFTHRSFTMLAGKYFQKHWESQER